MLASKSAVRRSNSARAGIAVEIAARRYRRACDRAARRDQRCRARSRRCWRARRRAPIADRLPGRLVLGADQTLALGERGFPSRPIGSAAREQLKALRGRRPTSCIPRSRCVRDGQRSLFEHRELARLTMRAFSDEFLEAYLDAMGTAVTASVGGYQLESSASSCSSASRAIIS